MQNKNTLYKIDPRVHVVFGMVFVISVLIHSPFNYGILTGLLLVLAVYVYIGSFPAALLVKRVLSIYPMTFFVSFLMPFTDITNSGNIIASILGFKIYRSGLDNFLVINLKMILIYSVSLLVTRATGIFRFLKSLEILKIPSWIISILTYMHRLFYLLKAEMSRMQLAFSSRYYYLPQHKRLKMLSGIVIVYLTRIVERSDRTYLAMVSKGFTGKMPNGKNIRWTIRDSFLSVGFVTYFGFLFYVF